MRAARALDGAPRLAVVGFSLGGNFALRVGLYGERAGLAPRLAVGISPAIHPRHTLEAIDHGPGVFHRYFLDKWNLTMDLKARAWPEHYNFSRHRGLRNFIDATRYFVEDYTEYDTLDAYFERYTLTPELLTASSAPLAIITAADDSVCPLADFDGLRVGGPITGFDVTARGGHCGFIENWRLDSWAERRVLQLLAETR